MISKEKLKELKKEAERCLHCKNKPCSQLGCPIHNDIPEMIAYFKQGDYNKAADIIRLTSNEPRICSRVCPHENQCEGHCVRGIKGNPLPIGAIEAAVFDLSKPIQPVVMKEGLVAIVGSGPAGLSCAIELLKHGIRVTIFEKESLLGGVPMLEIPDFRLNKDVIKDELLELAELGCNFAVGQTVGKDLTWTDLQKKGYTQVFWATGVLKPKRVGMPGEDDTHTIDGGAFLECFNRHDEATQKLSSRFNKAIIIGGGNVAMDCARAVKALGKESIIVYRRSFDEMPAFLAERLAAQREGVVFQMLTAPHSFDGQNFIGDKMTLGEPDASGRRSPIPTGETLSITTDLIIKAIGNDPRDDVKDFVSGIALDKKGYLICDEEFRTNIKNIYAGGDCVYGAKTVVLAAQSGKLAAQTIIKDRQNA